ncbi:hypothetical protein PR202_gb26614 [Eleusine coracana subsp. coracana]|uniref:Uncharacterized protein n=1 Tax=Eleusine coracana subsp. coracana TaxID=191504 RepID=A0AAV5FRY8_ELECO|nr:hypothetical protein PR202_gb26614 [Eleusine coracana subsp. coracana]
MCVIPAAVLVAALVLVVGAGASGDSLADLGGAAREIESAPGEEPGTMGKGVAQRDAGGGSGTCSYGSSCKVSAGSGRGEDARMFFTISKCMEEGGMSPISTIGRSAALICIAVLLPVLAFLGYAILKPFHLMLYRFVSLCWIIVAALFILLGIFLILNSAAKDTCEAMDQWAQHPQAKTALSNILPCVDESTTNRTLYESKQVVVVLVRIVNRAISALSNRRPHHKHPGQMMPYLCSPYDSNFNDRQCKSREVTFDNATTAWQNYTCMAPDTDLCSGNRSLTYDIYGQLVLASNVSYALYHYAPVLLNLQDCKFVRATFSLIASQYCPPLERNLRLVSAGLALIASGFVLYLLWMLFADRPQREEVSDLAPGSRITPVDNSP